MYKACRKAQKKYGAKQPPLFCKKTNEKNRKAFSTKKYEKGKESTGNRKMLLQFTSNRLWQSNSNVSSSDAKNATAQRNRPAVPPGQKKRGEKQKHTGGFVGIGMQGYKRAVFMPGNEKIAQQQYKNARSTPRQPAGRTKNTQTADRKRENQRRCPA